jgi:hypothetical protein
LQVELGIDIDRFMEVLPPNYQQNPVILNEPGVRCWISATSGKTSRGTTRQYLCSSEKWSEYFGLDRPEDRVGNENAVHWQITRVVPVPERDVTGWASFPQYFVTIHNSARGPWNVWPTLYHAVRRTFGKGTRVWIGAYVLTQRPGHLTDTGESS